MASVAVTENVTVAPAALAASVVIGPGIDRTGGVASTTLTLKVAGADVLPTASRAVQATVVTPSGNVAPDEGLHETLGAESTRSAALTTNDTDAPPGPVASALTGPGTVTVGGVVSTTVTVNEPAGAPLTGSVQLTAVGPSGNTDPGPGKQFSPALSYGTAAPFGPVASKLKFPGRAITRAEACGTTHAVRMQ